MTATAENTVVEEGAWNPGPRPGRVLVNDCEYREKEGAPWKRSEVSWSYADISLFNRAAGFEKYRVVRAHT